MTASVTPGHLVALRREIHRHPEPGFHEVKTAALVCRELDRLGVPYVSGVAQTGVIGLIEGGRPGPTLLIRADMDALPITERTQHGFASQVPGMMHACGHDGHTAMLIGIAERLLEIRDTMAGRVKLMFQPAEEGPGGAEPMIEAGLLENPSVDAALAFHLWNNLPTGQIAVTPGPVMASTDHFTLTINGKGGHGAMPERSVDAVVVAAHVVCALQSIASRQVSPLDPVVVTLGTINGGYRHNVIADQVTITGTVRAYADSLWDSLQGRIERIVGGVTEAYGASYELDYVRQYPAVVNDPTITELVRQAAVKVVGEARLVAEERTMGSEDMAYVLRRVPGCYFFVGSRNPAIGCGEPHHSPSFDFDEAAMGIGIDVLVTAAQAYLAPEPERRA